MVKKTQANAKYRVWEKYRGFTLRRINEPQFKHLWWLLFWPIYWLRYFLVEAFNPATSYHPIYCPLDDMIPFQECFIIPYMLWMVSMVALCLYTLFFDVDTFKRYSKFLAISMSISSVIFLLYPSCQNLRPTVYPRDNFLTDCVKLLHMVDTNTNVFPSEHAIGSIAVWLAALHTKQLRTPLRITLITVFTTLTCFSTVFLKQHSILDIAAAVPICFIAFLFCFRRKCQPHQNRAVPSQKKPFPFQTIGYIVFLAIAVIAFFLFTDGEMSVEMLLKFTPKKPLWAAVVLLLLYALKSVTIFFPLLVLEITAGHLLPPAAALAVNILGLVIILTLPYRIGRAVGLDTVEKMISKYPKFKQLVSKQQESSFFWCFFLRAINCLPGDIVTMYLGATKTPFGKNLIGGILGILPGTIMATLMGSSIKDPASPAFWLSAILFVVLSVGSFLIYYIYQRKQKKISKGR